MRMYIYLYFLSTNMYNEDRIIRFIFNYPINLSHWIAIVYAILRFYRLNMFQFICILMKRYSCFEW